ncbi:uncharacterized protein LOC108671833 [Hyalella azteca]|uniref:Uncharacterized protein LOC108671833 n=1 Tax=Hyalella azteca TaxID=294128 RepID=A0A8B7NMK9_HYAAZ|nr:uncharacterized protein LOC108671833 [Hyalella azteca]
MPNHHCIDDVDVPQYSYSKPEAENCSSRHSPTSVYVSNTDERLPALYASVFRSVSPYRGEENYGQISPTLTISEVSSLSTSKSKSCNNSSSSSDTSYSGPDFEYVGTNVAHPRDKRPVQRSSRCSTSEFRKVKSSLNTYSSVIMSRVADAMEKLETDRSEEDIFCEYLKKRLQDLGPHEKRRTIYKLHTVMANELDENGACWVPSNERLQAPASVVELEKGLEKLLSKLNRFEHELRSKFNEVEHEMQSKLDEARQNVCYSENVEVVQDV